MSRRWEWTDPETGIEFALEDDQLGTCNLIGFVAEPTTVGPALERYAAHLASAAEERGRADVSRNVAESVAFILIPEDTVLAERFLADFNDRRGPLGETP